jgi:hypothetical protein
VPASLAFTLPDSACLGLQNYDMGLNLGDMALGGKGRKRFFFEKKNQKTVAR